MLLSNRTTHLFSVFKGLQSYKGSTAQHRFHSYVRDQREFKQIKKTIDYETINKTSKGKFMIRQFLFQEKVQQNYIAPLNCYLLPQGKWTREEIRRTGQRSALKTKTQQENQDIIEGCEKAFSDIFKLYYKNLGKSTYKFILSEEIGKVTRMPPDEFEQFVKVLGGDATQIWQNILKHKK